MRTTRRHFLGLAAAAGLNGGGQGSASASERKASPNDRIQIATIGMGGMGTGDTRSALSVADAQLVAVCDLYQGRRIRAKEVFGNDLFATVDYREVLARQDVDAIIVATSDHWHSQICIDAMRAGKDVYCEKPMVHSIEQGKAVVKAQKETGRILQVGSQRVSSIVYQKAKDLLQAGSIGSVNMVEAWWDRNNAIGAFQASIPPDASPETLNWDRFIGNSVSRPFDAARFFRWRCYRDYGTGVAGDLFVHLFSGIHFVLDSLGPSRVFATGGTRYWKDGRDTPDVMLGLYDYDETQTHPGFNLMLRVNFADGSGGGSEFRFVGEEGVLTIGTGVKLTRKPREAEPGHYDIQTFPESVQQEFLRAYREKYPVQKPTADGMRPDEVEEYLPPSGYSDHLDHHRRFFHAVRNRQPVVEDAIFGFRAAAPALLSNMSYFDQRVCRWDPDSMEAS